MKANGKSTELHRLHVGDCRKILPTLGPVDLIFADPPFNIGQAYAGYDDRKDARTYSVFTYDWLSAARDALTPTGSLWVNVPDSIVSKVDVYARSLGLHRKNWVIWHYRFGQCQKRAFINSKAHSLWLVRDRREYTFNSNAVAVPSDRAAKYGDGRTQQSQTPGRRVPLDVWGVEPDDQFWGRVQGNNAERWNNHPNQLPEVYLERVVRACSNPGDLVCDPFLGSGTTGVVALALGRRFVGIDISDSNVRSAAARIERGAVRVVAKTEVQQASGGE